jgi:hypothetical protein
LLRFFYHKTVTARQINDGIITALQNPNVIAILGDASAFGIYFRKMLCVDYAVCRKISDIELEIEDIKVQCQNLNASLTETDTLIFDKSRIAQSDGMCPYTKSVCDSI